MAAALIPLSGGRAGAGDFPLARYEAMCTAIAQCHQVDEVKDWRDKARAMEIYARQAMNLDAERKAVEIRLRAERRTGQLMAELERTTPQRASPNGRRGESPAGVAADSSPYRETLQRVGIPERTAQRFQEVAAIPDDKFEGVLKGQAMPSTQAVLRAANGATRMDDGSLWLWGRLRDFERDGMLQRNPVDVFGGMTETMQEDVRRILPAVAQWLANFSEVVS